LRSGQLIGPESIAVRRDGVLYAGTADGHIVSVTRDRDGSDKVRIVATVGGRPLGLHFSPKDDRILYVAEAVKGTGGAPGCDSSARSLSGVPPRTSRLDGGQCRHGRVRDPD